MARPRFLYVKIRLESHQIFTARLRMYGAYNENLKIKFLSKLSRTLMLHNNNHEVFKKLVKR